MVLKRCYDWNVSNVTDMGAMFCGAESFNQPRHAPWYHSSEESEDESDIDSDSELGFQIVF